MSDMAYWITTHYPHASEVSDWSIYLRKPRRKLPDVGDVVFFYETGRSAEWGRNAGAAALVCVAKVAGAMRERTPAFEPWRFEIPCEAHRRCASVPFSEIRQHVRGFQRPVGLLPLDADQAK